MSYIKKNINKIAEEKWNEIWKKAKQGQQYSKFQLKSESKTKSKELKQAKRLIFSIFTQIQLEHEYFKFYLKRLSAYDSNLYNMCKIKQTPEHILLSCRIYKAEQKALKKTVLQTKSRTESEQNSELSLKRLLCKEEEIKNTLTYLNQTKIATRK